MREMKIAITALYRPEEYVMHLRNGDKKRGAVRLIGFFGGSKKDKETNLRLPEESLEAMSGVYKVISDRDEEAVAIWAKLFRVLLPYGITVEVAEHDKDELVALSTPDVIASLAKEYSARRPKEAIKTIY